MGVTGTETFSFILFPSKSSCTRSDKADLVWWSPAVTGDVVIGTACSSALTAVQPEEGGGTSFSLRFTHHSSLTLGRLRQKRSLLAPGE